MVGPGEPVGGEDDASAGDGVDAPDKAGPTAGPPVTVTPGDWVATLEVELPKTPEFVLRGTVPLPPGTWDGSLDVTPLAVVDIDGTPVPSQVEITSRYPKGSDGVDVAEIIARVHRPPLSTSGQRHSYRIQKAPHPGTGVPPHFDVRALGSGPDALGGELLELLADPDALEFRVVDPFGNRYVHRPLASEYQTVRKYGRAISEVQTYGVLMPEAPKSGPEATLPHLFGVHTYLRTFAGESALGLDVRIHNGFDGHDKSTPVDDALDKTYFKKLEVLFPKDWIAASSFEDPFLGDVKIAGQRAILPLVKALGQGKMHVMPVQAQFHRRLVLAPAAHAERAASLAAAEGQAFARPGRNEDGSQLWSWWNPSTARYFPQSLPVPSLTHVGLGGIRAKLEGDFAELEELVAEGEGLGDYPVPDEVLGWAHPWGVAYGGMTGGLEIVFTEGLETLSVASQAGLRYSQLVHRMHTSRQPNVAYRIDGEPTSVETWLVPGGAYGGYVPFSYFLLPKNDPFGVDNAPTHQIDFVDGAGLTPHYEDRLLEFQPHDFQHYTRYTRSPKMLAWLSNDKLAMDDLRMMAEAFHLSFHPFANNEFGSIQGSGLRSLMNQVENDPGVGLPFGRGEGWGTDCANAAYRTASPAWRKDKKRWLEQIAETVATGQASCTGLFQSVVNNKGLDGKYRVRQHIEHVIAENALRGLSQSVFRGSDPALNALTKNTLLLSNYGGISEMAWESGEEAPWRWTAVAPLGSPIQPWCHPSQLPSDWYEGGGEKYLVYQSLAHGYYTTGNQVFLDRALQVTGGTDLLLQLEKKGLDNIQNRGALLAVVQLLEGS